MKVFAKLQNWIVQAYKFYKDWKVEDILSKKFKDCTKILCKMLSSKDNSIKNNYKQIQIRIPMPTNEWFLSINYYKKIIIKYKWIQFLFISFQPICYSSIATNAFATAS